MASAATSEEISTHLTTKNLPPNPTWFTHFLTTIRPNTPVPALKQTALFRILASDITTSIQPTPNSVFPSGIHNGNVRERKLPGPILVQVLDIEDIGSSRWSQVEALEAEERGETTKGREVIRVVAEDGAGQGQGQGQGPTQTQMQVQRAAGAGAGAAARQSSGPHKLLLQDARGTRVYGVELGPVEKVDLSLPIGAKLVLRDVVVARGLLLLDSRSTEVLGGKIEELYKQWKEGRKERLKKAAGMEDS